jgi:dolichol-phosphate mannosyltransferase
VQQIIAVLPAYNEEESLPPLLEKYAELELPPGLSLRVIIVDDGSRDKTVEVATAFADRLDIQVVRHEVNRGLGPAILTGLRTVAALDAPDETIIVNMDADNTHFPIYILDQVREIEAGADLVIASRFQRGSKVIGVPPLRLLYSLGARLLFAMTLRLPGVRDYTCGFRAYRLGLVRRALGVWGDELIEGKGFACTDELLVKFARLDPKPKLAEVPFVLRYDLKEGTSKLPLAKTILATLKLCLVGHRPPKHRG